MLQTDRRHHAGTCAKGEWERLIVAEYTEMPGLHLSKRQAQRLWNLDQENCEAIFEVLEAAHFLKRMANDTYVRADQD